MPVPYTFGTATAAIPLSQLDSNFATAITLGNTAVYLGNTTTSIGNLTLTNVTISSGEVTTGNASVSGNVTLTGGTANGVAYLNSSKVLTTGSALVFDGTNLGVGVTPVATWSGYKVLQAGIASFAGGSSGAYLLQDNAYTDNSGASWKYINSSYAAAQYYAASGAHVWRTAASGTAGNAISFTQAMTLDASGNLMVGTTSSNARITVKASGNAYSTGALALVGASSGTSYITNAGGNLYFSNDGSTDHMVLDSSGNLLVGTTSTDAGVRLKVVGGIIKCLDVYNNTTASAANVQIDSNGNFARSTSSLKYKKDVQDATHGLAEVMALRSVTYKGKAETDAGKTFGGLIAEEVHAAGLTEFVQYAKDGSPDALDYGNMVSLLTKAIQEQQALITQLTARITALESA